MPHLALRRAAGPGAAWLGVVLVLALMAGLQDELNPDWLGYAAVYQDGGAWLADQGRDPLFLLLMGAMSALFGPDGYETFRIALAGYFAVFTYLLLRSRQVPADGQGHRWPLLLLGLLPFVAPRFTIQVREGLALTLVLFGLALLNRAAPATDAVRAPQLPQWSIVLLFAAGAALHSGTVLLLMALLAALVIRHVCADSTHVELWLLISLALLAIGGGVVLALFGLVTQSGRELVDDLYGALADVDSSVSAAKWIYWGMYGLGVLTLGGRVRNLYRRGELPDGLRQVLGIVTIAILPAIFVVALLMLGAGFPAIVVAGAARVMNMLLSVSLLVLALRGELNLRLGLFCVLVLVDQIRVIVEAVLSPGTFEVL